MAARSKAPDPTESLAALAAQVNDLRGRLLGVEARVGSAGATTNLKLAEQVAALAEKVAEFSHRGHIPDVAAPVWHDLDHATYNAQLADLTDWVSGFLAVTYPHVHLRPCWNDHPAAVWELSTLRAEWQRIYDRENPDLPAALNWHDRYLPGVAARLAVILKDCKSSCGLITAQVRALPQARSRPRAG